MKTYTLKHARADLAKLGFTFPADCKTLSGAYRWGRMLAQPVDTGKDHFTPKFRDIWISQRNKHVDPSTGNRFLVTSHIKGEMRPYRCRRSYKASLKFVSGIGRTLKEAVESFIADFNQNYPK